MKKKYKTPIKTVVISEHVHLRMIIHLEESGVPINRFVEKAIEAQIENDKRIAAVLEKAMAS